MTNPIRNPSLAELTAAGYVVNIVHNRRHKVAYMDPANGKLVVKIFTEPDHPPVEPRDVLTELLPKGGKTEVWVTDPETSAEFYGYAICREDENYNRKDGVNRALSRIIGLMLVMDGKEGFKFRLKC